MRQVTKEVALEEKNVLVLTLFTSHLPKVCVFVTTMKLDQNEEEYDLYTDVNGIVYYFSRKTQYIFTGAAQPEIKKWFA